MQINCVSNSLIIFTLLLAASCDNSIIREENLRSDTTLVEEMPSTESDVQAPQEDFPVDADFKEYESKGQDTSYTVDGLISAVLTDGKLDTSKVLGRIFHTLQYAQKSGGMAFTCSTVAYIGTNILIPIPKNQVSTHLYIPADMGNKRYHFMLINYKESISCKQYVVECKKEVFNYNELYIYAPYKENNKTQCALLMAVADVYLKDASHLININWQLGGPEDPFDHKGNIQFNLKKRIPGS